MFYTRSGSVNHVDVGRVADIHPTESSAAASRRRTGWDTQRSECRQRAIGRRRWWSRPGVEDVALRDGRHETRLDNATGRGVMQCGFDTERLGSRQIERRRKGRRKSRTAETGQDPASG